MNYNLAKKRISELQHFVDLVENYETVDFKSHVVKEYAITGSLEKTAAKMNDIGFQVDDGDDIPRDVVKEDLVTIINTNKKVDELHSIMRSHYRKKIKPYKR